MYLVVSYVDTVRTHLHTDLFFFLNDPATTEFYTLPLHDALPIYRVAPRLAEQGDGQRRRRPPALRTLPDRRPQRSEEHTSELQSRQYLVCRLLLEKKKKQHQSYKVRLT